MAGNRQQRVESQIQRVLATLIPREVRDPRVARVYVVPFAQDTASHPELLEGLRAAAGFLRGEVGRQVGLRHAPRLDFEFDDSFDKAERMETLLAQTRPKDSKTDP